MPPGLSSKEIEELAASCRRHLDEGVDEISLEEIAVALVASGSDGSDESKKILRSRDLIFRAWHDGKTRQEVMLTTLKQARAFYLLSPLLLALQIAMLVVAQTQLHVRLRDRCASHHQMMGAVDS